MSDFYKLLNVPRDASEDAIKKAYRKLAMELHPDRNKGHDAEERFKEVTEAYEVLRDPQKRAAYDRYGDAAFARGGRGGGPQGFHHVDLAEALNIFMRDFGAGGGFDSIFGGGQRARGEARRGQDLRVEVTLSMAEVATGTKRSLKIRTQATCDRCQGSGAKAGTSPVTCSTCRGRGEVQRAAQSMFGQFISVSPCPTCGGEGTVIKEPCDKCGGDGRVKAEKTVAVEIPAGVSSANYLTLRGQGAAGPRGGPAGDLLVMLEVKEDDRWTRQGDDLVYDLALSFAQAALGGTFSVPSPYGDEKVKVPAGTQAGTVFRVKGKGLPRLGSDGKGNLLVRTALWTPENLTAEQQRLFQEIAKLEGEAPKKATHGLWDRLREALGA
ncbi:MAG TPA: molecular chaperone DnaJ [Gemmatimonadales bacterium]|nr:molecular chaperone DnaJ [Gemmatimonadales bacterium]